MTVSEKVASCSDDGISPDPKTLTNKPMDNVLTRLIYNIFVWIEYFVGIKCLYEIRHQGIKNPYFKVKISDLKRH